jgi:hypothetical protein
VAGSPYPIVISNAVGSGLGNYAITYVDGSLTVNPPASFSVESVQAIGGSIVLTFSQPIDPASTVLYSSPGDTTLGPADITVVGAASGAVRGSLVIDPTDPDVATFVQTNGLLVPDTYTVTVTSAVEAVGGAPLGGGNYSATLTVATITTPTVSIPSFARGPGQSVVLPSSTGIPISISNVTGATQFSFTLTYDPTLLTIDASGALALSSDASAAGLALTSYSISNVDAHHELLTVSINGNGAGLTTVAPDQLLTITASVPTSALYLNKSVLDLETVTVNATPVIGVSGVQIAAYFGDVTGDGHVDALGASLVDQVGSGAGTGFSAYKDLDPSIIGAVSGEKFVSATDASLINQAGSGAAITQIPSTPSGLSLVSGGPDPYLYLSPLQGSAGQTVTETLYLDVTDPNGIELTALDEAIGFGAGELQISNVRGAAGLEALGSYGTASTVDNASGVLLVGQAFMGIGLPPVVPYGTDVAVLQWDVTLNADLSLGGQTPVTLLQDGTISGQTKFTAISDNEGALTWTPGKVPSNSGNPAIDGSVSVVTPAAPTTVEQATTTSTSRVVHATTVSVRSGVQTTPAVQVVSVSFEVTALGRTNVLTVGDLGTSVVEAPAGVPSSEVANITAPVQAVASVVSAAVTVGPVEQTPSGIRNGDAGVSLSLLAQGTNRSAATVSVGNQATKASTTALDEMFRLAQALPGAPVAGSSSNADDSGDDFSDAFDVGYLLLEQDSGRMLEEEAAG